MMKGVQMFNIKEVQTQTGILKLENKKVTH